MAKKKGKARWQVGEVVVERPADAPEIEVDAYARLVARILERQAVAGATDRAA